jgi:hypothetical protein
VMDAIRRRRSLARPSSREQNARLENEELDIKRPMLPRARVSQRGSRFS